MSDNQFDLSYINDFAQGVISERGRVLGIEGMREILSDDFGGFLQRYGEHLGLSLGSPNRNAGVQDHASDLNEAQKEFLETAGQAILDLRKHFRDIALRVSGHPCGFTFADLATALEAPCFEAILDRAECIPAIQEKRDALQISEEELRIAREERRPVALGALVR